MGGCRRLESGKGRKAQQGSSRSTSRRILSRDLSQRPPSSSELLLATLSSALGTPSPSASVDLGETQIESLKGPRFSPRFEVPDVEVLAVDAALQRHLQRQALLDQVPLGKSFDPETTAAWLDTVEVREEVDGRYQYNSPDGPDGAELGRGAFGRVLLAVDKHLGRDVALKELLPQVAASPQAQSAELRFVREARISGRLGHPNIVTVYDLGRRRNGQLYYTMKVVRGRTLETALSSATTLEQRLALLGHFSSLCQAIAYAHSQGVIHRDIKPENVMIGEFGETVVLDWGGARVKASPTLNILTSIPPQSDQARWIGTPLYMSPEQASGRTERVDETSDVWALGVVLYQLLTGRTPFEGKNFTELTRKIEAEPLLPIQQLEPRVPDALVKITSRALGKRQQERYPTAREMMLELDAYTSGGRVDAGKSESSAPAPSEPTPLASAPSEPTPLALEPSAPMPLASEPPAQMPFAEVAAPVAKLDRARLHLLLALAIFLAGLALGTLVGAR